MKNYGHFLFFALLSLFITHTSFAALVGGPQTSDEFIYSNGKIEDEVARPADLLNAQDIPVIQSLNLDETTIDEAQFQFQHNGVPTIPLRKAIDFYKANRQSVGGLRDDSCLIIPMSESGEIPPDQHRFDPTTISELRKGIINDRYIMIVDFTYSNTVARGYLLDMQADQNGNFHHEELTISHGYGSNAVGGIPQIFTNEPNKGTTVSGFHVTAKKTYTFYGSSKAFGKYTSTGLRLYGLESTNNTAEKTSKVGHGAPYNSDTRAGTSAGCPAMTKDNADRLLPNLVGGALWYHYTKVNKEAQFKTPSCTQ